MGLDITQTGEGLQARLTGLDAVVPGVGGYVAMGTYANIIANYPAASYTRSKAFATNIGQSGTEIVSDGSNWLPVNGRALLARSAVPYGIAPSGTLGTGTSGQLVLGTALPTTYSDGMWLYLPDIASTPAIAAGLYWCVFSSTTQATIYSNGPGSDAINITASPGAYTGSTSEVTLVSVTLPGNLLGSNGQVVDNWVGSHSNSGNSKTYRMRWNGASQIFASVTQTSSNGYKGHRIIANRGSALSQICNGAATFGQNTLTNAYGSIDTTQDVTITYTGQTANATDYLILGHYSLEVLR